MKNFITLMTAAIFLMACAKQNISAPVSTKSAKMAEMKKVDLKAAKSPKLSKETTAMDMTASRSVAQSNEEAQSSSAGFDGNSILSMVGSALLTGIISGLVSKAIQ
jgi:hypothetical protein